MLTHHDLMTAAPESNVRMNFFATKILKSSSDAPHILRIERGLLTKPQSSAFITRWTYSDWADSGMSRKASDSTMVLANILRSAI